MSHNFLAFWQNFPCGLVSVAFYSPIEILWWKKSSSEKVNIPFLAFCILAHWARTIGFFVENFSFGLSKLQLSWPRAFSWKQPFSEKDHSCFFLFCQRQIMKKSYWLFLKKTTGLTKLRAACPYEHFLRTKEFWKKSVLISIWDMGRKIMTFSQFFPAVVSKLLFNWPYSHFDNCFLEKFTTFLLTAWHLTKINFSLLSRKFSRSFRNFIFTCPQEHLMEKKETFLSFFIIVEDWDTSFSLFDKTFAAGWPVLLSICPKKDFDGKKIFWVRYFSSFSTLLFRTLSENNWAFCRKLFVWFVKTAIFLT